MTSMRARCGHTLDSTTLHQRTCTCNEQQNELSPPPVGISRQGAGTRGTTSMSPPPFPFNPSTTTPLLWVRKGSLGSVRGILIGLCCSRVGPFFSVLVGRQSFGRSLLLLFFIFVIRFRDSVDGLSDNGIGAEDVSFFLF